jgi:HAD superfamily hydrolase (TIGR01484 family)
VTERIPRPAREADFTQVRAVFTDVDGTLTTGDRLESSTLQAMERLREKGVQLVLVSGRPAGWGECWIRTLPVDAVIVENGGLFFARTSPPSVKKFFVQSPEARKRNRTRLLREVRAAMKRVPGARLSSDSAHTEVDIAIDYNEEAKLGAAAADQLETFLRARGVCAVRSSVHINCWIGRFNKLSTVRRYIRQAWKLRLESPDPRFVYVGDSFNDSTMFRAFSLAVGVANVLDIISRLDKPPAFVTREREGRGFEELVDLLLSQRR